MWRGGRFTRARGRNCYYLVWNLVLAWIPLGFAFAAYRCLRQPHPAQRVVFIDLRAGMVPVFPERAVHHDGRGPHPRRPSWRFRGSSSSSIMSYAWTGLCLGYLSLYLMQEVVRARCGRIVAWVFVAGDARRRARWGSTWALPALEQLGPAAPSAGSSAASSTTRQCRSRIGAKHRFVELMFVFLVLSYGILYSLTHLHEPAGRRSQS